MNRQHKERCPICGHPMRRVHVEPNGSWCWNCEPYRPGSFILPTHTSGRIERTMNKGAVEFLKALMFIFLGYGWAAAAYGHLPMG